MANASLNIPITGDASALIAEVNRAAAELKKIQEQFNNAFTTKGKKLKVEIDETLIEGSIADLKQKIKSLEETRNNLAPFDLANIEVANRQIEEYKNEIKRIQGIGVKVDIDLPPPGSINDIKRQIAELSQQRGIAVGIDLTNANLKLQELKSLLKSLETQGVVIDVEPISPVVQNSIGSLEKELLELRAAAKNIDLGDENEIARLNDKIKELEQTIQRYKGLSIDPSGKLTQSSAKARQAITSLSLVAQDLPFGFIAIQNNLPAVLQTFTELESKNKGLKGAFKELGSALVGPAGAFLAFSVVTSIVTSLIKEYGSLSNAIKVLTSSNQFLAKAQIEFNNETAKASGNIAIEDSKVRALTNALLDNSTPRKQQLGYYEELKKISPDIVSGIDKENLGTDEANRLISQNILLRAELVRLEIQESGIKAVAAKNSEALAIAQNKESNALNKLSQAQEDFKRLSGQTQQAGSLAITTYGDAIKNAKQDVENARKEIAQLNAVQNQFLGQLDPITLRIAEINGAFKEQSNYLAELRKRQKEALKTDNKNFALKIDAPDLDAFSNIDKIISRVTKYGDALLDIENTEKERLDALKKLKEVSPDYFSSLDLNKSNIIKYKEILEEFIRLQKLEQKSLEDRKRINELNAQFRDFEEKRLEKLAKQEEKDFEKIVKISFDFEGVDPFKELRKTMSGFEIEDAIDGYISKFKDLKDVYEETFPDIVKKNKEIADSINSFLTQPLTDVFDILLKDGEKSWKDFGNTVIDTLKRIAVQLIATAIAKTIANILAPGSGELTEAAFEEYFQQFGGTIRGGGKQANFGRIRGERSMAMSGQVNMVLRGSDLVGAMNRTNSTISRVG